MMLFEFDNASECYRQALTLSPNDKDIIAESKEVNTFKLAATNFIALMNQN